MVSGNYEVKERFYYEIKTEGDQMKAVAWHGKRDVRVDDVPDPTIQEPTDAIVRITTTNICGSDLHLYDRYSLGWGRPTSSTGPTTSCRS